MYLCFNTKNRPYVHGQIAVIASLGGNDNIQGTKARLDISNMRGCILPLALIATSVDAFAPALMGGLAVRALPLPAARASRMGLRMQEDAEKKPSGENAELSAISAVLDQAAEAKESKQAPAGRPAASQREEATAKPNNFASMALKVGALRQTSPLILSQMAGNKGFDPLGFANTPDLLLQYREVCVGVYMICVFNYVTRTPCENLLFVHARTRLSCCLNVCLAFYLVYM